MYVRGSGVQVSHLPFEWLVPVVAHSLQCRSFRLSDYSYFMSACDESIVEVLLSSYSVSGTSLDSLTS